MTKHTQKLRDSFGNRRLKRPTSPGAPAGLIQADPNAARTTLYLLQYDREEVKEKSEISVSEAAGFRAKGKVLWVRVEGLGDDKALTCLRDAFGLHRLAMEDAVNVGQRPKVERYGDVLFVVLPANTSKEHTIIEQVSFFVGPDFVISINEHPGSLFDPILRRLHERIGILRDNGADYLAYALIDCLIDYYYPLLASLGQQLDTIETQILAERDHRAVQSVHRVKQDLTALHRALFSIRDAVCQLPLAGDHLFQEHTRPYLRDLLDHTNQLLDLTDNQRQLTSDLLEIQFAFSSNRMNEIMKFLTVIGAIFLPLSFIAGIYGMNFDPEVSPYNMPELGWVYGYPFALGLMATTALMLLGYFWKKGWLR